MNNKKTKHCESFYTYYLGKIEEPTMIQLVYNEKEETLEEALTRYGQECFHKKNIKTISELFMSVGNMC